MNCNEKYRDSLIFRMNIRSFVEDYHKSDRLLGVGLLRVIYDGAFNMLAGSEVSF